MLTTTVYMHLMDNLQYIVTHQLTTFLITHIWYHMLQLYSQSCSLPVGQPTNVRPNFDDTASKLQRGVGKLSGTSNIRIFLICLNVKSYKKREQ